MRFLALLLIAANPPPMPSPLPDASPTVRGVVSTGAQSFGGTKTFGIAKADGGYFEGVNAGTASADSGYFEYVKLSIFDSVSRSTVPAAPSSGDVRHYESVPASGLPAISYTIDGFMGTPMPEGLLGAFLTFQSTGTNWTVGCAMPEGWGQSTIVSYNWPASFQAMGSAGTGAAWSSGSLAGRSKALRFTGTAAQNAQNGIKMQTSRQNGWRGNTAGAGGFILWTRFVITTVFGTSRSAVGLMGASTTPSNTADFDNIADTVYFGCKSGESTLHICSNDNSGSATCSDLGASYPCTANGAFYDVVIAAAPNSSTISYFIERLDSAAKTSGTLSSDLPRNTVQLNWCDWLNSADGGSATVFDWMGTCMAAGL